METIQKKKTNRQTTNEVERCGRKRYQDSGKKYDCSPGIGQRKMERIACGSSGPIGTVKLRKKKKKKKKKKKTFLNL
jgi:hypothetical protein